MIYDMFGYPIQLGDQVAYAPTGRVSSYSNLRYDKVKEISGKKLKAGQMRDFRYGTQVINISFLRPLQEVKNELPELFI